MEVSMFYGIRVTIEHDASLPPFYTASYDDHIARILIEDTIVWDGELPRRQLFMAIAWGIIHHDELMEAWEMARDGKAYGAIAPLR